MGSRTQLNNPPCSPASTPRQAPDRHSTFRARAHCISHADRSQSRQQRGDSLSGRTSHGGKAGIHTDAQRPAHDVPPVRRRTPPVQSRDAGSRKSPLRIATGTHRHGRDSYAPRSVISVCHCWGAVRSCISRSSLRSSLRNDAHLACSKLIPAETKAHRSVVWARRGARRGAAGRGGAGRGAAGVVDL